MCFQDPILLASFTMNYTIGEKSMKRSVPLKKLLLHGLYWVLITGFFIYEKRYLIYKASMPYFAVCVAARISLLIVVAYLNLHYFLPRYLLKKSYLSYAFAVLLSVTGYLIIQSLFDYYLYGYIIGPMRNSSWMETLSYNFFSTLWYLGLMLALKLSMDWYEQQLLVQRITVEKLQAEVNFLRFQVNPHFLFNFLNNLYALTLKKSEQAPGMVLKLSDMMEYMLYDSNDAKVPLKKEIDYLDNFIELEKLRFNKEAEIIFNIRTGIGEQEIAPFLLLTLVENAFKHGVLDGRKGQSYIHIDLYLEGHELTFCVENTKVQGRGSYKGGIGLINLQKRLDLVYPERHRLEIEDKGEVFGTKLVIEL